MAHQGNVTVCSFAHGRAQPAGDRRLLSLLKIGIAHDPHATFCEAMLNGLRHMSRDAKRTRSRHNRVNLNHVVDPRNPTDRQTQFVSRAHTARQACRQ
jgi:hypothetical protein